MGLSAQLASMDPSSSSRHSQGLSVKAGTKRLVRSDSTFSEMNQMEGSKLIQSVTADKLPENSASSSQGHGLTTSASANLSVQRAPMAPPSSSHVPIAQRAASKQAKSQILSKNPFKMIF